MFTTNAFPFFILIPRNPGRNKGGKFSLFSIPFQTFIALISDHTDSMVLNQQLQVFNNAAIFNKYQSKRVY